MTPLRDIRAVRELAEQQAGDLLDAIRRHRGMMSDHTEGAVVEAVLDLLCDLSRPASRDAIVRLVAERVGLEGGATAPLALIAARVLHVAVAVDPAAPGAEGHVEFVRVDPGPLPRRLTVSDRLPGSPYTVDFAPGEGGEVRFRAPPTGVRLQNADADGVFAADEAVKS